MKLGEKLTTLTGENTVQELNRMLKRTHVGISWLGRRRVWVEGYKGSVQINELAQKYLEAAPFKMESDASLQERLNCDDLWGKVQKLYGDSDEMLSRTLFYKYIVDYMEFRPYCRACAGDPQAIIGLECGGRRTDIFEFKPERFKKFWYESEKVGSSFAMVDDKELIGWQANRKMVERVVKQKPGLHLCTRVQSLINHLIFCLNSLSQRINFSLRSWKRAGGVS